MTESLVGLAGGLVVFGVSSRYMLLEQRKIAFGCSVFGEILEDRGVEYVQRLPKQIVRRASDERELRTACMSPHQEDQGFLHGMLRREPVVRRHSESLDRNLGVVGRDEVREVLPDELGQVVAQCRRRERGGGTEVVAGRI